MALSRDWIGARASVVLTLLVGVLSVVTGIANIGVGSVAEFRVLGVVIPDVVRQVTAFTGTLTGFVLLVNAFGLQRRLRIAWYAAMVLLPVTATQGILQTSQLSFPLIALSALAFVVVGLNVRTFDRAASLTTAQIASLAAVTGAQAYGPRARSRSGRTLTASPPCSMRSTSRLSPAAPSVTAMSRRPPRSESCSRCLWFW